MGEEPRGSPTFLRPLGGPENNSESGGDVCALRPSDTSRGLSNVMMHRNWKKNASLGKNALAVILA